MVLTGRRVRVLGARGPRVIMPSVAIARDASMIGAAVDSL
jgi:hypothetical protein